VAQIPGDQQKSMAWLAGMVIAPSVRPEASGANRQIDRPVCHG